MTFWIILWKSCFIVAVVVFCAMAVVVAVGGAFDIRKLIARLNQPDETQGDRQ